MDQRRAQEGAKPSARGTAAGEGGCISQAVGKGSSPAHTPRALTQLTQAVPPWDPSGLALGGSSAANPAWTCLSCPLEVDTAGKSFPCYFL